MRAIICLLVTIILVLCVNNRSVKAQVWNEVYVGKLNDWSPLVQVDEDGYVHFGNQSLLSNTHAQDPNVNPGGTLVHFPIQVPSGEDIYFPALAVHNKTPHVCYRHTKNGAIFTVGYWNPLAEEIQFYMEPGYHGHYPNIQVSGDGVVHIFYQMDDSNYGNIYYQNSEDLTIQTMMPYGFDGASTLYSYATTIDKNDNLHWIGSLYKYEDGHGKNLYYNHSTDGDFNTTPELLNGFDGYFPSIAVDDSGVVHAVWELDDILYSTRDESGWSIPVIISDIAPKDEYYLIYTNTQWGHVKEITPLLSAKNTAWTVGEGGITRTDDAWDHYETQYVNNSSTINGISLIDSLHAFCVGDSGRYWYTSNGGHHVPLVGDGWFEDSTGFTMNLKDCWFFDTLAGYAVGDSGTILKTTNGGEDWSKITGNVSADLYKIEFANSDTGYIAADSGKVLVTFNGGSTWSVSSIGNNNTLLDVQVKSKDTVWIAGINNEVRVSYDAGSTWNLKNASVSGYIDDIYGVYFVDKNLGYLVGSKKGNYYICKSLDGGNSWSGTYPVNGNGPILPLTDVYALNEDSVFFCGAEGYVYFGTMKSMAQYHKPGIAIDENRYCHVTYWGTGDHIYYVNNMGGTWSSQQTIKAWAYLEQIDGSSRIALDFKTNTIYVGARLSGGETYLVYTNDINLRAPVDKDETSTIIESSDLVEPTEITESAIDSINALAVVDFTIVDQANDGLPTKITQLNIRKGPESTNSVNFAQHLAGATLSWGSTTLSYDTITEGMLAYGNGNDILATVPEGDSITFTLKVWLSVDRGIEDGDSLDFKISAAHDVYIDTSGSYMAAEPNDLTTGAIQVSFNPDRFIFQNLPDGILYNSDYCFPRNFKVSIGNMLGGVSKSSSCSDLVLSVVASDSISVINGGVTITPSGAQLTVNGSVAYTKMIFTEGHQLVRLKAEGTIEGTPTTSYSEPIPIYPYANQIILRNDADSLISDPFIGAALDRLSHNYDVLNASMRDISLPTGLLDEYDIVWVDETDAVAVDSVELINFLNNATALNQKALAVFGCRVYGVQGLTPRNGGFIRNFGIGPPQMYPEYRFVDGTEIILGVENNSISHGISVELREPELFNFLFQTYPISDSTSVQIVFESNIDDHKSYPVPVAVTHMGTNYKTFRSGFYLDEYGDQTDMDTLVARLYNWLNEPSEDTLGRAPYFTNSLMSSVYDVIYIDEDVEYSYTAYGDDDDPGSILSFEAVAKPEWMSVTTGIDYITVEGTPLVQHAGENNLVLKVRDEQNNYTLQHTKFEVQHINRDPSIEGPATDNAYVDIPYYCVLTKTDPDTIMGDEMSWFITYQSHMWIDLDEDGNLYGTPSASDIGITDVSIIVMDLYGGMATHDIAIDVQNASGPVIDVSPAGFSFAIDIDSSRIEDLELSNLGTSDLNWSATKNEAWLNLNSSSGVIATSGSTVIDITFNASGLSPAVYIDTITISSDAINEPEFKVPVEMLVSSGPMIEISLTDISVQLNQDASTMETIVISNTGSEDLNWSAIKNTAWISLSTSAGTIIPSGSENMEVTIDATGLAINVYYDTISISSNASNNPEIEIPVEFEVSSGPTIEISPTSLSIQLDPDESTDETIQITNSGLDDLHWSASKNEAWLTLNNSTGMLSPASSEMLDITIDATGLIPDSYQDTILISSDAINEDEIEVPVWLEVNTIPLISVSPLEISTQVQTDETTNESIEISNIGSASLNWAAVKDESWISLSSNSGSIDPASSDMVSITLNAAGLNTGDYYDTLVIQSNSVVDSVLDITIYLEVIPEIRNNISDSYSKKILVYPSIANEMIYIYIPYTFDNECIVDVINTEGRIVAYKTLTQHHESEVMYINITDVKPGNYYIRIILNNDIIKKKIIIAR